MPMVYERVLNTSLDRRLPRPVWPLAIRAIFIRSISSRRTKMKRYVNIIRDISSLGMRYQLSVLMTSNNGVVVTIAVRMSTEASMRNAIVRAGIGPEVRKRAIGGRYDERQCDGQTLPDMPQRHP